MMRDKLKRNLIIALLTIAFILALSSIALAAGSPKYIYYVNQADELVMADYEQAVDDLIGGDPRLRNAIKSRLIIALQNFKAVYVEDEDGTVVNYASASSAGLNYLQAYNNPAYHVGAQTPVKQLIINPVTGVAEEVPISIFVVESVSAIDRTTIEVTLAAGADPSEAADETNYTVAVGGTAVPVTVAAYNSVTRVATLTVNLTGLSGACVVNGVTAAVDVPPLPVFSSITTVPGSFTVVLNFNTEVYDLNNDLLPANFTVTTDGNPNTVTLIDVANSANVAETTITLTLTLPTVGNTVTEVALSAAGAAKIGNIWDEATTAATKWQLTPDDTEAPLFIGVRAVAGGYTLYLDFSEAVHTGGNVLTAGVALNDDVRVTVNGVRIPSQTGSVTGVAAGDATDSIKVDLDLSLADLFSSGDVINVTLDANLQDTGVANRIRDLSNNVFEGQRTRAAVLEAGAGLKNADASTLLYNGDQDLDLSVTMDGALAAGATITVYLEDLDDNGFNFTNGAVSVTGSTGTAIIAGGDTLTFTAPAGGVPDNTQLTFTIEEGGAAGEYIFDGTTDSVDNSPHDVIFQRSDVGTTAEAECAVVQGFSTFVGPSPTLVSAEDNQAFNFSFKVEGALAAGKTIEMDLTALAAKVDFSNVDATETEKASTISGSFINTTNHTLTKSGNKLIITTGTGGIADGATVFINLRDSVPAANIVDVDSGAAGQHNLVISRNDSGVSATFKVTILANIINGEATNLVNDKVNQAQIFKFTVDGNLAFNEEIKIIIADTKGIVYSGTEANYSVSGATMSITNADYTAPTAEITLLATGASGVANGTVVEVTATVVNTTGVINETIDVEVERQDNNNADTFDFDVGVIGSTTVTVTTTAGLNAALADATIDTIILANNITLDANVTVGRAVTIDLNSKKLSDSGGDTFAITAAAAVNNGTINTTNNNLTIAGAATFESVAFEAGNLTITADLSLDEVTLTAGTHTTTHKITLADDLTITAGTLTFTGAATAELDGGGNAVVGGGTVAFNQADMDVANVDFAAGITVTMTASANYEGVTFISAVSSVLANTFDDCQFNSTVAVSSANVSTFINSTFNGAVTVAGAVHLLNDSNVFNALVTNTNNNSDYTGSVFNGAVTNTAGDADYTDCTFIGNFTLTAGNPDFTNITFSVAGFSLTSTDNTDGTADIEIVTLSPLLKGLGDIHVELEFDAEIEGVASGTKQDISDWHAVGTISCVLTELPDGTYTVVFDGAVDASANLTVYLLGVEVATVPFEYTGN